MKYYVDSGGNYLGDNIFGVLGGLIASTENITEVLSPPDAPDQIWDGNAWTEDQSIASLSAHLASTRYNKEVSGFIFMGMLIPSDDRAKVLLNGAYNKALEESDPTKVKKFKVSGNFQDITNNNIILIALALAEHVQKCFDAEASVLLQIQNSTLTSRAEIEAAFDAAYAA